MTWLYWCLEHGIAAFDPGDIVRGEVDGVECWMIVRVVTGGKRLQERVVETLKQLDELLASSRWQERRYRGLHVAYVREPEIAAAQRIVLDGIEVSRDDFLAFLRFERPDDWYARRLWGTAPAVGPVIDEQRGRAVLRTIQRLQSETGVPLSYQLRYLASQGWLPKEVEDALAAGTVDDRMLIEVCAQLADRQLAELRSFVEQARWIIGVRQGKKGGTA